MEEREQAIEKPQGSLSGEVVFEFLTNDSLKCADCRFRIPDSGVLRCHKFDKKPSVVLEGGDCIKYKPE